MNFKQLALQTLSKMTALFSTINILQEFSQRLHYQMKIGKQKSGKNNRTNPSGYVIKEIDAINHFYMSLRVCDHLPKLQNYIMNPEIPSDKKFAHICLMFMGYDVWRTLGSMKGNIGMGKTREEMKVPVSHQTFQYYKNELPKDIPYHIYHFIPEFLTKLDLDLIADNINYWLDCNGGEEFVVSGGLSQNAYYHEHKQSGISSIDCKIHIVASAVNEDVNVNIISGAQPILSISMGSVIIVSPDGEELMLYGTLNVMKCKSRDFSVLQEIASSVDKTGKEDFSFDAALKAEEETKKRFESLKQVQNKYPELYEKIMKKVNEILDEYIE